MIQYNIEIFVDKIIIKKIKGRKYIIPITNEVFFSACKKYNVKDRSGVLSVGNLLRFEHEIEHKKFKQLLTYLRKAPNIIDRVKLGNLLVNLYYMKGE